VSLRDDLAHLLEPARVLDGPADLAAYSSDASFYRMVPRAVVRPRSIDEVRSLFAFAARSRVPLTFRAAGTSLSGQAVTDGIVVDVSRHWRGLSVEDGGRRVRVGPGVIGGFVNRRLESLGRKLGPDPASIDACMIGGIVSNNSSGMCCGTENNAYRTLEAMTFVLPSGTVVDTASPGAHEAFAAAEPGLARGLAELRDRVRSDAALSDRIRRKYRLKNTVGYSINAFLDFADPLDILWHLIVGGEGTLAFVAEAVFRTVPDLPRREAGLLFFDDVFAACASIQALRDSGAAALELMDRASLRSVAGRAGVPDFVASLPPAAAAILVEYQAADDGGLAVLSAARERGLEAMKLLAEVPFTRDPARQAEMWTVRKGLIPSVGAMRRRGTSLITEDVVFPVETLAPGVVALQGLFAKHGYDDAIVFGHAKDGNLHFLLVQGFGDPTEIERYARFTDDLVELVVGRHDGALKAEHGTGRNMAPFVEVEWGRDAYDVMKRVKALVDPDGILNPGVILNPDPAIHLKNLKDLPEVDPVVDACIECGFCEPKCPSRDLTLTPRQRIMVRREGARLALAGRDADARALDAAAAYAVVDSCAADGLCATSCPVDIDTGKLVKRLRHDRHAPVVHELAALAARRFALVERAARFGLRARLLVAPWMPDLPEPAPALPWTAQRDAVAVYLPSCVTRVAGPHRDGGASTAHALVAAAARAGSPVWIPEDVAGTCCGLPFQSKGFSRAHAAAANNAVSRLWSWSGEGRLPVVIDTSPCTWTLRASRDVLSGENLARLDRMRVLDGVEFAHDLVLPGLTILRRAGKVAVHPVCSAVKLGVAAQLREVASACALEIFVPPSAGCCGFAGDRGFLVPELTAAATFAEAQELRGLDLDGCYATSRTCEIGLSRATGRAWLSIWRLLDDASR
jgi:D-lactate dehydrogenase